MYKDYKDAIPPKDEWQFTETDVQTTIFMVAKKNEFDEFQDEVGDRIKALRESVDNLKVKLEEQRKQDEIKMKKLKRVAAIAWVIWIVVVVWIYLH